jgi:hypothetical protein
MEPQIQGTGTMVERLGEARDLMPKTTPERMLGF